MFYDILLDGLCEHDFMYSKEKIDLGSHVILSSSDSLFIATVIKNIKKCDAKYNFVRFISNDDQIIIDNNKKNADSALLEARKIKDELKLDMSFVDSFYTFDKKQLYFFFVASERIDFRLLARRLADKYRTRIELRQIGVRDKAKRVGGLGPCGLFLCCNSFLTDFNSVSINMAKNQNLALNPSKINGVCGRLLCCLNYENDSYTELRRDAPKVGGKFKTKKGDGKVVSVDLFHKTCNVELPDKTSISCSYLDDEKVR